MNTIRDVYRHTFPKKLRFDKASQILHAEVLMIARRHKHKKYIPKSDIRDVLSRYEPLPCACLLHLPVLRHVLLVRPINSVRCFMGRPSWLVNRAVDEEFARIRHWLDAQERAGAATSVSGRRVGDFVRREQFVREVLDPFHVATMYQRMLRLGFVTGLLLLLLAVAAVNVDAMVYLYVVYGRHMRRAAVLEWFRAVTERHVLAEVPSAYKRLLPPPCVLRVGADGRAVYALKAAELVSPNGRLVVVAVPCPQVGERRFFVELGESARLCDAVAMEGIPFERIDKIVPAALFPLRGDTFPALGAHHRFLDIIRGGGGEPPFLYPAGSQVGWMAYWTQFLVPFELRCVYWPTSFSASKGEARNGWGRLRELIEEVTARQEEEAERTGREAKEKDTGAYVIYVPWTVNQIVNLEASLVKYGFRVRRVFTLDWLDRDHMGEHFCNYYNIAE